MKFTRTVRLYLSFSFLAAALILLLVGTSSPHSAPLPYHEKMVIGSIFILCCCLGISFTVHPNWIRYSIQGNRNQENIIRSRGDRSFRGHHPDCPSFHTHRLQMRQMTWCAGCLGLFIGLCVTIAVTTLYLISEVHFSKPMPLLLLLLGLSVLLIVYSEIIYRSKYPSVHVVINSMLPLDFFLITVAVIDGTGELTYGLFTILVCFLWLDTRIRLSRWRHNRICTQCSESCKRFADTA